MPIFGATISAPITNNAPTAPPMTTHHGKDVTPAQLALAWVMAQGDDIVPIPGTRRRSRLEENIGAVQIQLTPEERQEIATALPSAVGERYGEIGMRELRR